jgi:hypothetical protein
LPLSIAVLCGVHGPNVMRMRMHELAMMQGMHCGATLLSQTHIAHRSVELRPRHSRTWTSPPHCAMAALARASSYPIAISMSAMVMDRDRMPFFIWLNIRNMHCAASIMQAPCMAGDQHMQWAKPS